MLAVSAVPALAADALPTAVLVWESGQVNPACNRSDELERNVAAYLGRDAFEASAPITIRVSLRRGPALPVIVADISKIGEDGKVVGVRSVSGGASCESLDDALTLVVALMLEAPPEEPVPASAEAPVPSAPPEPAQPEPAANEPALEAEEPPPPPGFLVVSAGVGSALGLLPFPNVGPRLQIDLKPRRFWGIALAGQALLGSRSELPGSGAIGYRLLQTSAALCPADSMSDSGWFSACAGLELAWLEAEGSELAPHRRKTHLLVSPALRLQVAKRVAGPLLLGGSLQVSFPISRNRYTYRDEQGARQLAFEVASPSLMLGVFAAFRLF